MRAVVVGLLAGAACFSPRAPSGAPCDPQLDNCPSGLACYAVGGEYRCLAGPPVDDATPGTDTAIADDAPIDSPPSDAAIDAAIDAMIDAPSIPMTLTYTATVADCVEPGDPDPDDCLDANSDTMAIDLKDTTTQDPWYAYVRFDIDAAPAGKTVQSVKLRMTTTNDSDSEADHSGVVWHVQPFTHLMLFTTEPARIGSTPIAPTQGAVTPNEVVEWTLPTTIVTANAGVYLSFTTPDDNGTAYGNLVTGIPPRLIVVVQ